MERAEGQIRRGGPAGRRMDSLTAARDAQLEDLRQQIRDIPSWKNPCDS